VCKKGELVNNSASVFLKKMNITPFEYGMEMIGVYSDGAILSPEMVNMTPEVVLQKFTQNASNIASMSLQLNIPTLASVPHLIANSFKNVCAIALENAFEIKAMSNLRAAPV
jgi:large subunit ribosomal protein LP0